MGTAPIPHETLLAHREWVRAVARAVVRDPNAADDVEQETWLAALRTPPRESSSLRGWFGAVTRSRARRIGRTDARRAKRETAVARRDGATASAAELAELADTHRRVVQAVVDLDEPYRETILLRYFEGLAVEDVARRTGAPLETTRSRLKRGVAKLRERLAREFAVDERPWHLALLPLIGDRAGAPGTGAATAGGLIMAGTTKTAIGIAAVALLAGAVALAVREPAPPGATVAAAPQETSAPSVAPVERPPERAVPRPARARSDDPPPAAVPAPEPKPAETAAQKLGRVAMAPDWTETPYLEVLAEIAATADVEVVVSEEAAELLGKDASMESFHLDRDVKAGQVLDLVTQLKGVRWAVEEPRVVILPPDGKRDATRPLVVLPKWTKPGPIDVTGRVTDAGGAYAIGARLVQVRNGARPVATTDSVGHYDTRLDWPYGSLEARIAGQVRSLTSRVSGAPGSKVTLDFALRGPAGALAVRVVGDAGPLKDAEIRLFPALPRPKSEADAAREQDQVTATTGEDGTVLFPSVEPGAVELAVTLDGYESERRGTRVEAGGRAEVETRLVPKTSLKEKLDTRKVSFDFRDARADGVVKFLNDSAHLSVILDPALHDRSRTLVTLSVKDATLREALRAFCEQVGGVTFDVREKEEIVWIHATGR